MDTSPPPPPPALRAPHPSRSDGHCLGGMYHTLPWWRQSAPAIPATGGVGGGGGVRHLVGGGDDKKEMLLCSLRSLHSAGAAGNHRELAQYRWQQAKGAAAPRPRWGPVLARCVEGRRHLVLAAASHVCCLQVGPLTGSSACCTTNMSICSCVNPKRKKHCQHPSPLLWEPARQSPEGQRLSWRPGEQAGGRGGGWRKDGEAGWLRRGEKQNGRREGRVGVLRGRLRTN